jgi:hypothetical protein
MYMFGDWLSHHQRALHVVYNDRPVYWCLVRRTAKKTLQVVPDGRLLQLLMLPDDEVDWKHVHVGVGGQCNSVTTLVQLCAFVGGQCNSVTTLVQLCAFVGLNCYD